MDAMGRWHLAFGFSVRPLISHAPLAARLRCISPYLAPQSPPLPSQMVVRAAQSAENTSESLQDKIVNLNAAISAADDVIATRRKQQQQLMALLRQLKIDSEGAGATAETLPKEQMDAIDAEVLAVSTHGIGALEAEIVAARMARTNRIASIRKQCQLAGRLLSELDVAKTDKEWCDVDELEDLGASGTSEAFERIQAKVGALTSLRAERAAAIDAAKAALLAVWAVLGKPSDFIRSQKDLVRTTRDPSPLFPSARFSRIPLRMRLPFCRAETKPLPLSGHPLVVVQPSLAPAVVHPPNGEDRGHLAGVP